MTPATILEFKGADGRPLHPPHNVDAEQALLGAVFMNNAAIYRAGDFLLPEHFYEPVHRQIWEVMGKLVRVGKAATPITVKTYLPDGLTEHMTMAQYLVRLASHATTIVNAADFANVIHDLSVRRSLISLSQAM